MKRTASEERIKKANSIGYAELVSAVFDETSFGIVEESRTKFFPDGDCAMAWKNLKEMFEPSTASSKVMLKKEFAQSRLTNPDKDPEEWITELELLRQRLKALKVTIDDEDFVLHIINNLPKEYDSLIEAIEEDMDKGMLEHITVKRIRERIRGRFHRMKKRENEHDVHGNESENALSLNNKKFKGRCRLCGKFGHKKVDCTENHDKINKAPNKSSQGSSKNPRDRFCNFCKRKGHTEPFCYAKKQAESKKETDNSIDMVLTTMRKEKNCLKITDSSVWIADSGATMHATNSLQDMSDLEDCKIEITVGNGNVIHAIKKGKKRLTILQGNQIKTTLILSDVYFVPHLHCNLFSLTSAMKNGGMIKSNGQTLTVTKGSQEITFTQVLKSQNGYLLGIKTIPSVKEVMMPTFTKKKFEINVLHSTLAHANESYVKSTAKHYGWEVTGNLSVCENCAMAKSKQKNTSKVTTTPAEEPGDRLFVDISSIQHAGLGGSKYWCLLIDEASKMKWSFFLKKKSDQVEKLVCFIKDLRAKTDKKIKKI